MTKKEFIATCKKVTGKQMEKVADDLCYPITGFTDALLVYADHLVIERTSVGHYYLLLANQDWYEEDLNILIDRLYDYYNAAILGE